MASRGCSFVVYATKRASNTRSQVHFQRQVHHATLGPSDTTLHTKDATSHTTISAPQKYAFHTSPRSASSSSSSQEPSTTSFERARSSWIRRHKPSQDADDDVVPSYYIERKRQADEISERKEAEGGLMSQLAAGILSNGIAAQTRVRPEKIPVEVKMDDGTVSHPSGFVPPTPETNFHRVASKAPTIDHPRINTVKVNWDESLQRETKPEGESSASTPSCAGSNLSGTGTS